MGKWDFTAMREGCAFLTDRSDRLAHGCLWIGLLCMKTSVGDDVGNNITQI